MTTTQAYLVFIATWILAYIASTTATDLKKFQFTPEQAAQLAPGAVEFLALLGLAASLMPIAVGVFGLFRFKWYMVLLAVPLTFVGAFVFGLVTAFGLRSINIVNRSILLLIVSIVMLVLAIFIT